MIRFLIALAKGVVSTAAGLVAVFAFFGAFTLLADRIEPGNAILIFLIAGGVIIGTFEFYSNDKNSRH